MDDWSGVEEVEYLICNGKKNQQSPLSTLHCLLHIEYSLSSPSFIH